VVLGVRAESGLDSPSIATFCVQSRAARGPGRLRDRAQRRCGPRVVSSGRRHDHGLPAIGDVDFFRILPASRASWTSTVSPPSRVQQSRSKSAESAMDKSWQKRLLRKAHQTVRILGCLFGRTYPDPAVSGQARRNASEPYLLKVVQSAGATRCGKMRLPQRLVTVDRSYLFCTERQRPPSRMRNGRVRSSTLPDTLFSSALCVSEISLE